MKKAIKVLSSGLLIALLLTPMLQGQNGAEYKYSLWVGGHYNSFNDYTKKVGEYNLGNNEFLPELMFNLSGVSENRHFTLDGHYFDDQNIFGLFKGKIGDKFKGNIRFRSLSHQLGQNLLEPFEAREAGAGKILTHELKDAGADYKINRNEFEAQLELLLSKKNNVRIMAAHRTIIEKGTEQKISVAHCFSCHATSETADVDNRTYIVKTGIEAEAGKTNFGYTFGYRKFHTKISDSYRLYDDARHPVNGTAGEEFGSRLNWDGVSVPYDVYPETEKMSHRAKFNGELGKGRFAASFNFNQTKNKRSDLQAKSYGGKFKYFTPLSPKTKLIANVSATHAEADDPFIDMPIFRDGRSGPQFDLDYTRYSAIDRTKIKGTAEVVSRVSPTTTVAILGGIDRVDRADYPEQGNGLTSTKLIGQLKLRHRKGMNWNGSFKYRFEKTSDPFVYGRGLFERRGRDELKPAQEGWAFVYYHQREELRYQTITTLPTDRHELEGKISKRFSPKVNLGGVVSLVSDKNGELDSLDVKGMQLNANIALTLTPNPQWIISTGASYNYDKSRGPVTVALFDG